MNEIEMFSTITIIGIFTLLNRAIFIYYLPEFMSSKKIKRGMSTVPASMLVSLVIPFTFFIDQQFIFNRPEVYAIIIAIPLIHFSKRYSYGLIIAMICYFLIDFFLSWSMKMYHFPFIFHFFKNSSFLKLTKLRLTIIHNNIW